MDTTDSPTDTRFLSSLKRGLLGSPACRLVLVCNFEAEHRWARNHVGLPAPGFSAATEVVTRMEELGLLLAGPADLLILKHPPDPDYLAYLDRAGLPVPEVAVPENVSPGRSTTEDTLDSPLLLDRLAALGAAGARLLPMAVTDLEQKLADTCGLPLAAPDAATFERVNSKIYGRELVAAAGLRTVPGDTCRTVDELTEVLGRRRGALETGTGIVVKDAFGVSGKGLVVLDSPARADRLARMVRRRAERTADDRLDVVVEEWVPKRCDLNYQVTVARDGRVVFDFVKQALTEGGVHHGHLMPAPLDSRQLAEIEHAAHVVGGRLRDDGYFGVAGLDAVLGADGTVYPVLEINARLNMSTYQGGLTERCLPAGHVAMARHYPLTLDSAVPFAALDRVLGALLDPDRTERMIVTCFGTVNADAAAPPFRGRLYALLTAGDRGRLAALDTAAGAALATAFPSPREVSP